MLFAAVAALAACGGSAPEDESFTIGGSVTGLTTSNRFGSLVLRNNGGNSLTVAVSGAFSFSREVSEGRSYAVAIFAQPAIQTCTVANGTGTANADVSNVAVTCVNNAAFTLGGTVSGLSGTLVLHDDSVVQDLTVGANGAFAFATPVPMGAPYAVTVRTQPNGQTCTVQNGAGAMGSANVTNVAVTCSNVPPGLHSIGGTVSGLTGGLLQIGLWHSGNMNNSIDVRANGAFNFDRDRVSTGDGYFVNILTQPAGQRCSLTNGTGIANADVTNIVVTCVASTTQFSVGGVITGLGGAGLRIESGASNSTNPGASATTFTLPVQFANGVVYDVGIAAQPAGQTCVITSSNGVVAGGDVTNVRVTCIDNVTDPLVGTYTAPLLAPGEYPYLTFFADGVYIYGGLHSGCDPGVEYGVYDYDAAAGTLAIKSAIVDTNDVCGLWAGAEFVRPITVAGSGQNKTITIEGGVGSVDFVPVPSTAGQLYGSFADRHQKNFWLFLDAGGGNVYFFNTETQAHAPPNSQGHEAGVESACGAINGTPASGTLNRDFTSFCQAPAPVVNGPVDTNGTAGLSGFFGSWSFDVSGTQLTSSFDGKRVIPN